MAHITMHWDVCAMFAWVSCLPQSDDQGVPLNPQFSYADCSTPAPIRHENPLQSQYVVGDEAFVRELYVPEKN